MTERNRGRLRPVGELMSAPMWDDNEVAGGEGHRLLRLGQPQAAHAPLDYVEVGEIRRRQQHAPRSRQLRATVQPTGDPERAQHVGEDIHSVSEALDDRTVAPAGRTFNRPGQLAVALMLSAMRAVVVGALTCQ